MLHAEVDLQLYQKELESFLTRERRCFFGDITSPYQLISNEIIRNNQRLYESELDRFATDLVLFSPIAAHRAVTKLGGLPYRNRDLPWPLHKNLKTPMKFIGQLCFLDSKEKFPHLPGDILLIFGYVDKWGLEIWEVEAPFIFEWVNLNDHMPLVEEHQIPSIDTSWEYKELWGHLYRTYDFRDNAASEVSDSKTQVEMAEYISEYISNYSVEKISALPAWKPGDDISTYSATKIGGLPAWIQGEESRSEDEIFLGQISSLCPKQKVPYPFIDCYPNICKRVASRVYSVLFAWGRQLIFVHEFFWENKLYLSSHLR